MGAVAGKTLGMHSLLRAHQGINRLALVA